MFRMRHSLFALAVFTIACGGSESAGPDQSGPPPVSSVTISATDLSLRVGETAQLTATPFDAKGAALTGRAISWATSDATIATVSNSGLVSGIAAGGPISITATIESRAVAARVTVSNIPVSTIELLPVAATLEVGDTTRITAVAKSATGAVLTNRPITWTSGDLTKANVTQAGLVTSIATGTVQITAASEGKQASAAISIIPASVASIAVTPATSAIDVGTSTQLAATLRDARGTVLTGRNLAWSSSNVQIATVAQDGRVAGVAIGGPVTITVASEGKQGTSSVTIRPVSVARVDVTSPSSEINEDASVQLAARATDATGAVITGRATTWSSDSPTIATVDATGLVRPLRTGVAMIRARTDGVDGTIAITVRGLIHRWTFSEEGGAGTTFQDDVGGKVARIVAGTSPATALGGQVTLTGGAYATSAYVALPSGILSKLTDATIEVWATVHTLRSWSRVFDVGSSTRQNLFMAWSQLTIPATDRVGFSIDGIENRLDNALAPFTRDMQQHIVMSIDQGGGSGGKTRISLFLDGQARGSFETSYTLSQLLDTDFWLGRSHYSDETANASYDEVRIHDRAWTTSDAQMSFVRGPVRTGVSTTITIAQPIGMRDTVRGVDVRFPLRAVGRDAQGRQFPVAVRWTSNNSQVATVDSTGSVHALATGRVEFTATAGSTTARTTLDVVRVRRVPVDPYLATPIAGAQWELPVIFIEYQPTADGTNLDVNKAPDYYVLGPMSLDSLQSLNLRTTKRRKMSVEQGSRFRGYKDAAALPSLGYRVIEHIIVYDQVPPHATNRYMGSAGNPRFEDWRVAFAELQLEPLMRSRTVREVWVAWSGFDSTYPSYDPTRHKVEDMRAFQESNMSSPTTGDISNGPRFSNDAPVLDHTYIIYGISFRRSQAEAVHNVGHQLEQMFEYVAQRQDGNSLLFWQKFAGFSGNTFVPGRAGATHFPPNAVQDYDYLNTRLISSDIEDWRPDNSGIKKLVNVDAWGLLTFPWPGEAEFSQRIESQWYIYWFQNMPGRGNQIPYGSSWMTNWWALVANWDSAILSGLGLYSSAQAASRGIGVPFSGNLAMPYTMRTERRLPSRRRE